ncbi:hypothetical protein [Nonomuraea pusilla]|uniref:Uncharacterized protein n=1 Tax=Nonomuraea pusilla TaxID=46177 RepID=A0A1H7WH59_9ACTN|nr:hypothetical protein [Nonomuraea pusilla]SEM20445.1 hypothetical protein SAMN05660976_04506 [Nonomuraea pusilla]
MFTDPPAPEPLKPGEGPPAKATGPLDGQPRAWEFNPDYQKLVVAWQTVVPLLEQLRTSLDKAYQLGKSPQTWDAPVGERYVEDIREWRSRLALYRHAVLTAISDQAVDTPRWIPSSVGAPHAFP